MLRATAFRVFARDFCITQCKGIDSNDTNNNEEKLTGDVTEMSIIRLIGLIEGP